MKDPDLNLTKESKTPKSLNKSKDSIKKTKEYEQLKWLTGC